MTQNSGSPATDEATDVYMEHRELLFSLVYNVLGSVADTEDVLQETWLSWTGRALRTESVSLAMLVVLESLTPLERAVFVLNEVFGYPHTEIADIIDRTPAAVRQLAHRARAHVHARRPLYRAHPRVRREATERFVRAALGGDIGELMEILAPDVTVWTDGGGKRKPAGLRPVHGRDKAVRLIASYAGRRAEQGLELRYRRVNGDDAAVVFQGDSPYAVMVMDLTPEGDRVSGLYIVTNPDKLTHVHKEEE
ncbi:sigma factor-like helix-turn-helix DNA-binding protein [Streptomyces sp. SLBN-31]|uniref:sigma factor-like helix-turn-helix DNA-binding protein n=1 Tax=Streptomyces sp. SLBN-31 TaxID=2768444 RepID=UPI00114FBF87|nr:sigma factor-like helix-turn-helix DNA-binding protein [Streptomyces sp. SLBN-31]TQJ91904.1 DNA-directed RNA polymerase specialized sigma24 family protein [Streptomyces sp. SLBN-31]